MTKRRNIHAAKPASRLTLAAAAFAAALAITHNAPRNSAAAQNALGDGSALDANQRLGSGGRNTSRPDFAREVRLRNAIVTGNAVGGRSFRGDVGYTAAADFRAGTAGDDLFAFERDSFYSGLATRGVRGINDVRSQLALTTNLADAGRTPLALARPGAGATADATSQASRPDVFNQIDGTLRSTASFITRPSEVPETLSLATTPQGQQVAIVASPLAGIRQLSPQSTALRGPTGDSTSLDLGNLITGQLQTNLDNFDADFASPDNATANLDANLPNRDDEFGDTFSRDNQSNRVNTRAEPQTQSQRTDNRLDSSPLGRENLLRNLTNLSREPRQEQPATPERPTTDNAPNQQDPANQLPALPDESQPLTRDQLQTTESLLQALAERLRNPTGTIPAEPTENTPDDRTNEPTDPNAQPQAEDDPAERAIQLIRRSRTTVDSLEPSEQSSAAFRGHMTAGQRWLEQGRWFDAEERFTAALTINPGSLEAEVGRINAQIGAGLYTSAALNLRNLFRNYPELTTAVYDQSLLPRGERLTQIIRQLESRTTPDNPPSPARDAALLLAFLGFQTERSALVESAFTSLDRIHQREQTLKTPLETLLQRLWTE